jgi:hypothetical protein
LAGDGLTAGFAVLSAVILGLATGAETDLIAFLAGRYFGMAHYGRIYGMLYMPFGLASAVSPAVYGWVDSEPSTPCCTGMGSSSGRGAAVSWGAIGFPGRPMT